MTAFSSYPIQVEADYPESSNRFLALLGVLFFVRAWLLLPHMIVLYFIGIIQIIVIWFGFWGVLFTGKYPRGMFDFVVGATRWQTRANLWSYGITDKHPPFNLN